MHLDGVAFDLFLPAVELCLQIALRQHRARPVHQRRKDREFAPRQADAVAVDGHRQPRRIERHAVVGGLRRRAALIPAADGADAGGEFLEIERLAEIVVRAGIQSPDAVGDLVERGQQQHRGPVAAGAQFGQQIEARSIRQHQIEHQCVECVRGKRGLTIGATGDDVERRAVQPEPDLQPV